MHQKDIESAIHRDVMREKRDELIWNGLRNHLAELEKSWKKLDGPDKARQIRHLLLPFRQETPETRHQVIEEVSERLNYPKDVLKDTFRELRARLKKEQLEENKPRQEHNPRQAATPNAEETTCFVDEENQILYEEVWRGDELVFLYYDPAKIEFSAVNQIDKNGRILYPLDDDLVREGAVKLVDIARLEENDVTDQGLGDLVLELEQHIGKYVDAPPTFLRLSAFYVVLSWFFERFQTLPYLRALGDTGTGKSRWLTVVGELCRRPMATSGCTTAAPIFRSLQRWKPTLLLDESDLQHSDESNELVKILNVGFSSTGGRVIRCSKDNPDKLQTFDVYSPKLLVTRKEFVDKALESRCLTQVFVETSKDMPIVLNKEYEEERDRLRRKLLLMRLQKFFEVNGYREIKVPQAQRLEPRLRQLSQPLEALFYDEPEVLRDLIAVFQEHQRHIIEERANTKQGLVVNALLDLLGDPWPEDGELTEISASDIARKLEDQNISERSVGKILKGLGLETRKERIGQVQKRYIVANHKVLNSLRRRYRLIEESEKQEGDYVRIHVPHVPHVPNPVKSTLCEGTCLGHEIQATENVPETSQPLTSGNCYESERRGTFGTFGTCPRGERVAVFRKEPRKRRGVNDRQYPLFGNEGPEEDVEVILHVRDG